MRSTNVQSLVLVCTGSDCREKGAKSLRREARETVRSLGAKRRCLVARTKCMGMCKEAPVVCVQPGNTWLQRASAADVRAALQDV